MKGWNQSCHPHQDTQPVCHLKHKEAFVTLNERQIFHTAAVLTKTLKQKIIIIRFLSCSMPSPDTSGTTSHSSRYYFSIDAFTVDISERQINKTDKKARRYMIEKGRFKEKEKENHTDHLSTF